MLIINKTTNTGCMSVMGGKLQFDEVRHAGCLSLTLIFCSDHIQATLIPALAMDAKLWGRQSSNMNGFLYWAGLNWSKSMLSWSTVYYCCYSSCNSRWMAWLKTFPGDYVLTVSSHSHHLLWDLGCLRLFLLTGWRILVMGCLDLKGVTAS